jgi:hypothetical protein
MSRSVRAFAALVLTVLFLASPVAAASLSKSGTQSLWDSAWQWLVELVLPDGPKPPDPRPNGDAGGTIDPDGMSVLGATRGERAEAQAAVR